MAALAFSIISATESASQTTAGITVGLLVTGSDFKGGRLRVRVSDNDTNFADAIVNDGRGQPVRDIKKDGYYNLAVPAGWKIRILSLEFTSAPALRVAIE